MKTEWALPERAPLWCRKLQGSMHKQSQQKTGLQHTTTVWYGGSCTKKYGEVMDTSIQVLSNTKIFSFIYWHSILGWYNQPCQEAWRQRLRSLHIWSIMPWWIKQRRLLIMYPLGTCTNCPSKIQTKTDYDIYVWLERRHTGYLTKKVVTHVVTVYHKL